MTDMRARVGSGLAGAAIVIAVVTILARATGFLRIAVFARTAGVTCLSGTYVTANTIPNIVFDVLAGGALASFVVPVLAGAVGDDDGDRVNRTTSALLTWTLIVLVPIALVGIALARPVMGLFVGHPTGSACPRSDVIDVGTRMLLVFLPQIPLYGIGIVLTGVLQSHRRFIGPALAPLLSSITVIGAYVAYGIERHRHPSSIGTLPRSQELTLSIGTTGGVAVLSLSLLIPLARTHVRLRPTLSFPPGVAVRVRRLAYAGAAALAAQQLTTAVALRLANSSGTEGAALLYNLAWTVFLLPWAILAVPIATSAFPALSAQYERGAHEDYARTAATTTRAVLLVTLVSTAAVAATADPVARVLIHGALGAADPTVLARAIALFAPGIVGYSLVAHLGRAFYARGNGRDPAIATVVGWVVTVVADLVLVATVPASWTVAALAAGTSIGMTVSGVLLVTALGRAAGRAALDGTARALFAGASGAAAAYATGYGIVAVADARSGSASIGVGLLCGAAVLVVFVVVVLVLDGGDLRDVLRRTFRGRTEVSADHG